MTTPQINIQLACIAFSRKWHEQQNQIHGDKLATNHETSLNSAFQNGYALLLDMSIFEAVMMPNITNVQTRLTYTNKNATKYFISLAFIPLSFLRIR